MARTQEELMARAAAVRAAYRQEPTPEQAKASAEAKARKAAAKAEKTPEIQVSKSPSGELLSEREQQLERSLAVLLGHCEKWAKHHQISWLTSSVLQDFASQFDAVRGVK
jgi:hypothetical protein